MSARRKNRILLPLIPIFRKKDGGAYSTGGALPYIIEELVAYGVGEIIVEDGWRYESELQALPPIFRKSVKISTHSRAAANISASIFQSIFQEYNIKHYDGVHFEYKNNLTDFHKSIVEAAILITFELTHYIVAVKEQAQCDFPLTSLVEPLAKIIEDCEIPEARANASILKGLFSSYGETHIASILKIKTETSDVAWLFEEIVFEAEYKTLSETMSLFGLRRDIFSLRKNVRELVRSIVASNRVKTALNIGSKTISASSGFSIPDSTLTDIFSHDLFLPPVLPLRKLSAPAITRFVRHNSHLDIIGH